MIRHRMLPSTPPYFSVANERDFRRVVDDHIREVAENDRSFRARFISGAVTSSGTLPANNSGVVTVSGFNGQTARVLLTASGGGENTADPGAVEAWVSSRSATGCNINFRNTSTVAQSVAVDYLAVVPE